jgi:hypothetical protein
MPQAEGQIGRMQGPTMPIEIAVRRAGSSEPEPSAIQIAFETLKRAARGALPGSKFERALATQTVVAAKPA